MRFITASLSTILAGTLEWRLTPALQALPEAGATQKRRL
jgi:hypothetical protein